MPARYLQNIPPDPRVTPEVLGAVRQVESGGNPKAIGPLTKYGRAQGGFQILPSTAKDLGVDPLNPDEALRGANNYLNYLMKETGDLKTALGAYNWGLGNVKKKGIDNAPKETVNYIDRVMALLAKHETDGGNVTVASNPVNPQDSTPIPEAKPGEDSPQPSMPSAGGRIPRFQGYGKTESPPSQFLGKDNPIAMVQSLLQDPTALSRGEGRNMAGGGVVKSALKRFLEESKLYTKSLPVADREVIRKLQEGKFTDTQAGLRQGFLQPPKYDEDGYREAFERGSKAPPEHEDLINRLDKIIANAPAYKNDLNVFRTAPRNIYPGMEKGYLSTSYSPGGLRRFGEGTEVGGPLLTNYAINIPEGTPILAPREDPFYTHERELLLPRGSTLHRTTDITPMGEQSVVFRRGKYAQGGFVKLPSGKYVPNRRFGFNRIQSSVPGPSVGGEGEGMAGGGAIRGGLSRLAKMLGADEVPRGLQPLQAVKEQGGQWLPGSAQEFARSSIQGVGRAPQTTNIDPAKQWAEKAIPKYIERYMGAKGDPLADVMVPHGQDMKRWEEMTDPLVSISSRRQFADKELPDWAQKLSPETHIHEIGGNPTSGRRKNVQDYISHVLDHAATIPPEKLKQYDFPRLVQEVQKVEAERAKKMAAARIASMEGMPVHKEYPTGYKWVQLTKPGEFAGESDIMGHSVRGYEPPKGHPDWTDLSAGGGHPTYGAGGWDAIKEGRAKVYSLRDPKGESHATVEVVPERFKTEGARDVEDISDEELSTIMKQYSMDPRVVNPRNLRTRSYFDPKQGGFFFGEEETVPKINQIKGKQNLAPKPEYQQYIQDLIRSGKWGDVKDLENSGLKKTPRVEDGWNVKQVEELRKRYGDYHTQQELDDYLKSVQPGIPQMAEGGRVPRPSLEDLRAQLEATEREGYYPWNWGDASRDKLSMQRAELKRRMAASAPVEVSKDLAGYYPPGYAGGGAVRGIFKDVAENLKPITGYAEGEKVNLPPRQYETLKEAPQNKVLGALSRAVKSIDENALHPMQKLLGRIPLGFTGTSSDYTSGSVEGLAGMLAPRFETLGKTLEEASYGMPLTTGRGMTLGLKDDPGMALLDLTQLKGAGTLAQDVARRAKKLGARLARKPDIAEAMFGPEAEWNAAKEAHGYAGGGAVRGGLSRLAKMLGADEVPKGLQPLQAVKEQGGQWLPGSSQVFSEQAIHRGWVPTDPSLEPHQVWAEKAIPKYIERYMGAKGDPLADAMIPHGSGMKRWESLTDPMVSTNRRIEFEPHELPDWAAKLDPQTKIHGVRNVQEARSVQDYISHVLDHAATIPPENLKQYDFPRLVQEVQKVEAERAKKMAAARIASMEGMPVHKEYPTGYKWVQLTKPGEFAGESDIMGHSVRGYEPPKGHPDWTDLSAGGGHPTYGAGGWDAIKEGRAKVYSLRDPKGESHATVEVYPSETTASINQIKGKQNLTPKPEYQQYIQDLIRSGKWSDVRDLENSGLKKTPKVEDGWNVKQVEELRKRYGEYHSQQELDDYLKSIQPGIPQMKKGGKVKVPCNKGYCPCLKCTSKRFYK